jgi:hypothetical protein
MAAASTKTTTTTEMPDFALKLREQLFSTVQQGQQMTLDAAKTWVKAASVLPVHDLPTVPGIPSVPGVESATKFTFDIADDLLKSQRDFVLNLTDIFAVSTSA